MIRKRVLLAVVLTALLSWSCSDEPKSLARVSLEKDTLLVPDMLHLTLGDGRSVWRFGPDAIGPDRRYTGQWWSPEVETISDGTLTMWFRLEGPGGLLVSSGKVSMPLREDWRWGIGLHRFSGPPRGKAFGEVGRQSFEIIEPAYAATDSDSVWVIWGGNSVSNPVIY